MNSFNYKIDLSPLRYPGSKRKFIPYINNVITHNNLPANVFVEPFVGGGSVFLYFIRSGQFKKAIISDKNPLVSSFWITLFKESDCLIRFIKRVKISLANFKRYKNIAQNSYKHDTPTLAKACLFLNRTSFSGLLTEKVGPIGGKNQDSPYAIDCRFNRSTLINRIESISLFSKKVIVLDSYNWNKTIKFAIDWIKVKKRLNKILLYLDPPFFMKASDLYREFFKTIEHEKLRNHLTKSNIPWILSYDNNEEIKKLYSNGNFEHMNIVMPYSLNSHAQRIEKELIITPLDLPIIDKN